MSCAAKLCVFNAYHEQILMFYGCFLQVTLCVVDAYYEQGHMFMVNDTCEFMCCGCMVLAKFMLEDPSFMASCY